MNLQTNAFDITKSVLAIVLVLFTIFKVFPYFEHRDSGAKPLDETVITRIAENVVKATLAANDVKLSELKAALEAKDSITLKAIKQNNEKIKEIGVVVAKIKGTSVSKPSDIISDGASGERDIDTVVVKQLVANKKKMPVATVYYSPNVKKGDKWAVQTHPLKYNATVVSSEDRDGNENRYVEFWAENDFVKESKGVKYELPLDKVDWVKKEPKDKEFMFNPRLGISANFGATSIYPGLDLSLFSYGKTKRDMDWRFLSFGVGGTSKDIYVGLIPISYNMGEFLPLVENMFIGPYIGTGISSFGSKINYGVGISVPF